MDGSITIGLFVSYQRHYDQQQRRGIINSRQRQRHIHLIETRELQNAIWSTNHKTMLRVDRHSTHCEIWRGYFPRRERTRENVEIMPRHIYVQIINPSMSAPTRSFINAINCQSIFGFSTVSNLWKYGKHIMPRVGGPNYLF